MRAKAEATRASPVAAGGPSTTGTTAGVAVDGRVPVRVEEAIRVPGGSVPFATRPGTSIARCRVNRTLKPLRIYVARPILTVRRAVPTCSRAPAEAPR